MKFWQHESNTKDFPLKTSIKNVFRKELEPQNTEGRQLANVFSFKRFPHFQIPLTHENLNGTWSFQKKVFLMSKLRRHLDILCNYHDDFVANGTEALGSVGGYSGATFWKIHGKNSSFCLRRWATKYPTLERLQFIHAVQWYAQEEGFVKFPMPVDTIDGMSYVSDGEYFWQLEPWMNGKADFRQHPSSARMINAMTALAELHLATESFPLPAKTGLSQAFLEHEKLLLRWTDSQLARISNSVRGSGFCQTAPSLNSEKLYADILPDPFHENGQSSENQTDQKVLFISDLSDSNGPAGAEGWQMGNTVAISYPTTVRVQPRLQNAALRMLPIIRSLRRPVLAQVVNMTNKSFRLQPCLHDIHPAHLFFEKNRFNGFIDFGSVCVDSVATDVAKMLCALTESRPKQWLLGLNAYQSVRPLSADELAAIQVFRKSSVLTTAIRWLNYIFLQNHPVKCSARLVERIERLADALERL